MHLLINTFALTNLVNAGPPSNMSVTNTSTKGLLEVNEGQVSLLKCTVESGNPSENMMWVQNDSILLFGGPKFLVYEFVPTVTDHSKIYICIANNSETEDSVQFQVQLYVKELPYVNIRNVSASVLEVAKRGDIVLDCDYKTNTKPYKLTWIFKNESLLTDTEDGIPLTGALHISRIRTNNTGTYKCYVYNTVGIGSAMVDVLVTYKPELKSNDSLLFDTEVGRPAFISIAIRSFEKPTASWTSSAGGILGLLNVKEEQNDMFSIKGTIVPSTDHHFGKYGIRIRNRIGGLHTEIVLTYTGPPIILTSITKKHSNNIVLSTFFVSDPPANNIAWIFIIGKTEKQIVSNSAIFNVLSSNSSADISVYGKTITINCIRTDLKLVDPKSVKEGWFLCLISNILGSSETVFNTTYKYTTESHTDTILYSSMFPMKSSEAPFAVIDEEISNENSDACQDIAEQEPEEEVDLVHSSIAEESISATDTNVYEDLNEVPKEINPTNSEHYKTIKSEMPILDHNSDDENYLIPGPAYLIVIDSDQEKEAKTL
ncbi:Hypothetical predicted protein [Mytilus galloprovincialis]|uniref:Ig-like domain-containing protein n=1 Tax=Mytilus galloprovincialis TaxID=29158 RepID=A0A8B6HDM9_MYTGA|nr:Hypothetical predicted protein [Mytilus galloprovincialis]